jgi:hypothetical protein
LALKAQHEEEKERFEGDIKKLMERLKERDGNIDYDDRAITSSNNDNKAVPGQKGGEAFANPIAILRLRVNKIVEIN